MDRHHPIYLLSEAEISELHSNLAAVLRCAGLADGPQLDETIADCFTIATSALDKHRLQEEQRRDSIKLVKG